LLFARNSLRRHYYVAVNLILALFLFGFAVYMFKVLIQLAKKAIVALDIYIQNHKK
jgi:hypothetical protein